MALPRVLLPIQAMLDVSSSISWEYLGLFGLFVAVYHLHLLCTPLYRSFTELWCDLVRVDQLLRRSRLKKAAAENSEAEIAKAISFIEISSRQIIEEEKK